MQSIFIFGHSGFIGSKLTRYLNRKDSKNIVTVGRKDADISFDLKNPSDTFSNSAKKDDAVVFLASLSSPDICTNNPELAYEINVTSTLNIIDQLTEKGVKLLFASTDVVFGKMVEEANDKSDLKPFGFYGKMKADVEKQLLSNPLVKVIRLSYVMGDGDKYTAMLSTMAAANQVLDVFEGFERNVVALYDVLDGIDKILEHWDEIEAPCLNFGGPELISRWELTKMFAQYHCPELSFQLKKAPKGFWDARPKRIEMASPAFAKLLARERLSVIDNVKNWKIL